MEPVGLSDDSSDKYQMSHPADETELDTETEGANLGGADDTTPRRRRGPRLVETHGNNRPRTVRMSTNSGSQEAEIVPRMPAARVTITQGRPLSPASFPSSSVARYSSPLGVPSTTTSGIRSSCPPGEPSTGGTVSVRHVINWQRNTGTGVEGEILGVVIDLVLPYTLYVNPLPNPVAWTSEVPTVWSHGQDEIRVRYGAGRGGFSLCDPTVVFVTGRGGAGFHFVTPRLLRPGVNSLPFLPAPYDTAPWPGCGAGRVFYFPR